MSRYEKRSRDMQYSVGFGWDNPLETYFATVAKDDSDDDNVILWVGMGFGEIESVNVLLDKVAGYVDLTIDEIDYLRADKVEFKLHPMLMAIAYTKAYESETDIQQSINREAQLKNIPFIRKIPEDIFSYLIENELFEKDDLDGYIRIKGMTISEKISAIVCEVVEKFRSKSNVVDMNLYRDFSVNT